MSDKDFVDVGDELVVRIAGYPIGKARVNKIFSNEIRVTFDGKFWWLPLDVKNYDVTDGVAHELSPRGE